MDNPASGDFAVLRPAPGPGPEAVAWEILLVNRHGVLIDQNARPAPPADPPPDAALAAPLQTPAVQAVFAEALALGQATLLPPAGPGKRWAVGPLGGAGQPVGA